jgi:lipopolysaccharide export system protein LptA
MSRSGAAAAALLIAAGLGWCPGSRATAAAPPPPRSGPSPGSSPHPGAAPVPRPPLEVTGATRIEYDDGAKQWTFSGARVVIVRGTVRVEAPEIAYNERAREVVLPQGGTVLTPTLEVSADRMAALLDTRHVTAEGHVAGRFAGEEAGPGGSIPSGRGWGTFTADRVEADDRSDLRQIAATGDVIVEQGDRRLRGDRIVYAPDTQQGTAEGHAEVAQGSDVLHAERVLADLGRHDATADGDVLLDHGELHGSADHATYTEATRTAVLWGHATLVRGRDTLTAERVTVLLDRDSAIAEGRVRIVAYPGEPSP